METSDLLFLLHSSSNIFLVNVGHQLKGESARRDPFLRKSKDGISLLRQSENNAQRNPGRLQTAAYKSFGMQGKDRKELVNAVEEKV